MNARDELHITRAALAEQVEINVELLSAMKAARMSLQVANDTPNGPINDTIWHSNCETLFDFMDAAIEKAERTQP